MLAVTNFILIDTNCGDRIIAFFLLQQTKQQVSRMRKIGPGENFKQQQYYGRCF
jgi:hypothetical protein